MRRVESGPLQPPENLSIKYEKGGPLECFTSRTTYPDFWKQIQIPSPLDFHPECIYENDP